MAFRLAWRQAREQTLRTVAIVATLALPIAVITAVEVVDHSEHLTTVESLDRQLGAAQALVSWLGTPILQDPAGAVAPAAPSQSSDSFSPPPAPPTVPGDLLPPRAVVHEEVESGAELTSARAAVYASVEGVDLGAPPLNGLVRVVHGRLPNGPGEVAVTATLAHQLRVTVGSTIRSAGDSQSLAVVGVVRDRYGPRDTNLYTQPDTASSIGLVGNAVGDTEWFVTSSTAVTWADTLKLNQHGFSVVSRSVVLHPPTPSQVPYDQTNTLAPPAPSNDQTSLRVAEALVAAMVLLEVVLLAGPAFAIGTRRRRYELALVAASGGNRRHLLALVATDGLAMGGVAAVIGAAVGVGGAAAALAFIPHWSNTVPGALTVPPLEIVGLASLAIVTGVLAALVPALAASRPDTAKVLRGRMDQPRLSLRFVFLGVLAIAVALILAFVDRNEFSNGGQPIPLIAAAALGEIGFALVAPGLLAAIGRLASRLPTWSRLALRDASRNRSAAAAAVAAIIAVVAATATGLIAGSSAGAHDRSTYQARALVGDATISTSSNSQDAAVAHILHSDMPGATVLLLQGEEPNCGPATTSCRQLTQVPLAEANCPVPTYQEAGPGGVALIEGGTPGCLGSFPGELGNSANYLVDSGTTIRTLIGGRSGSLAAQALHRGDAVVFDPALLDRGRVHLIMGPGQPSRTTVPAVAINEPILAQLFALVLPPATARSLNLPVGTVEFYVKDATRIPNHELTAANVALVALGTSGLNVEPGFHNHFSGPLLAITAGEILLTLGAAVVATALIGVDSKDELLTMAAIGAGPRSRRRLAMARAGIICAIGAVFGTLAGLVPGIGLVMRFRHQNLLSSPPGFGVNTAYPLSIPWSHLALVAIAAPLIAVLSAALLTRPRLPIERRRAQ